MLNTTSPPTLLNCLHAQPIKHYTGAIKEGQISQWHVRSSPLFLASTSFSSSHSPLAALPLCVRLLCVILIIMEGLNNVLSLAILRMSKGYQTVT